MTDDNLRETVDRLESLVNEQQETIENQQEQIEQLRGQRRSADEAPTGDDTGAEPESATDAAASEASESQSDDGPGITTPATRRGVLTAGGVLGLLGLGAGTASADPSGQIGTANDPLSELYTRDLKSDYSLTVDIDTNDSGSGEIFTVTQDGATTDLLTVNDGGEVDIENGNLDLNGNNLETTSGGVTVTTNDNGNLTLNPGSSNELNLDSQSTSSSGSLLARDGSGNLVEASSKTLSDVGGGGGSTSKLVTSGNGDTGFQVVDGGSDVSDAGSGIDAPNVVGGHPDNNTFGSSPKGVFIGGGGSGAGPNSAEANYATVGGGRLNEASGRDATVGGGNSNTASGKQATVGGGNENRATGKQATVPGGNKGGAKDDNAFVWNDGTKHHNIDLATNGLSSSTAVDGEGVTGSNTFSVNATSGFRFITGGSSSPSVVTLADDGTNAELTFHSDLPDQSGTQIGIDSNGKLVKSPSSARYKTNIQPLSTDTSKALQLEPKSFEYEDSGQHDTGLIAEEVDEILPELVHYDEEGRPESVQYDRVGVYLVPEVDENRERLADVETDATERDDQIADLETQLDAKDARIEDQRDRIDHLESRVERKDDRIDALEAENDELRERLAAVEQELGIDATADQRGVADD